MTKMALQFALPPTTFQTLINVERNKGPFLRSVSEEDPLPQAVLTHGTVSVMIDARRGLNAEAFDYDHI
jgi:hypothetical protein